MVFRPLINLSLYDSDRPGQESSFSQADHATVRQVFMTGNVDLTLVRQVRAKYSAELGTIVFISAVSQNIDELKAQVFSNAEFDTYHALMIEHLDNGKAYFVIDHLYESEYSFFYACQEFLWEEELATGRMLRFSLNPFKKIEVSLEMVKQDLAKLGSILSGNA